MADVAPYSSLLQSCNIVGGETRLFAFVHAGVHSIVVCLCLFFGSMMIHPVEIRHCPSQNWMIKKSAGNSYILAVKTMIFHTHTHTTHHTPHTTHHTHTHTHTHSCRRSAAPGAFRKFLESTTRPLATLRCHGSHAAAPPRYSSFTLWNWVVQAQGFRNTNQHLGLVAT